LTVLHKWLIFGRKQTPKKLKQQTEISPPSSSIFINSTQSPALPGQFPAQKQTQKEERKFRRVANCLVA
jgi:hypothetical protein